VDLDDVAVFTNEDTSRCVLGEREREREREIKRES
jgi:hypothetical protein